MASLITLKDNVFSFWQWFTENHKLLENRIDMQKNLLAIHWISQQLEARKLPCTCQAGRSEENGKYLLSLRANGDKTLQFICRFWREQAPEPLLAQWDFLPFHPALLHPEGIPLVMDGKSFDPSQCRILCRDDNLRQKFDLQVYSREFLTLTPDERARLVLLMLHMFLGEALTEIYLGSVEVLEEFPLIPMAGMQEIDFAGLKQMIAGVSSERGWQWSNDPTQICFGFRMPQEHPQWEELREDISIGFTRNPRMLEESHTAADELRSMGGSYCYLYYDNADIPDEELLTFRDSLISKVEQLLELYGIGYVIGASTGTYRSYIDLIIFDEPTFRAVFRDPYQLLGIDIGVESFLYSDYLQ